MSDFLIKNRLIHTLCERTAKALVRLRGCAGSPEPSLVAYVINTKISWACSLDTTFTCCRSIRMKYSRRISLFCSQSFLNHYNMFCTSIFPFSVIDYTSKHISAIKLWCDSNLITAYAIILGFRDRSLFMPRGGLEEFRFILKKILGPPPLENKAIFQDSPHHFTQIFQSPPPPDSYNPNTHTQTLNWYISG